jgi:BASS family bile acid:Na+ symporter
MEKVKSFAHWLTQWFTLIVIIWAVFNYFVPQSSVWAKSDTEYLLGVVLFGMGLTLSLDDFARIIKQPLMVIIGTVAHYLIMPLIAVLLCWFLGFPDHSRLALSSSAAAPREHRRTS